jgi:ribosomal protein L7/L12
MAERSEVLPPEAIDALQRGNKIEAIKIVREASKLDLKDAKDQGPSRRLREKRSGIATKVRIGPG